MITTVSFSDRKACTKSSKEEHARDYTGFRNAVKDSFMILAKLSIPKTNYANSKFEVDDEATTLYAVPKIGNRNCMNANHFVCYGHVPR